MRRTFGAAALMLALLAATAAHAESPGATLAQFIGLQGLSGSKCCPTPAPPKCCATPVFQPKCCPPPVCEPKCCPPPVCEPKCAPRPIFAPKCGCEPKCCPPPTVSCCEPCCTSCCKKQYPLERLLAKLDGMFGNRNCCKEVRDPCGYWMWLGAGACCNAHPSHGYAPLPGTPLDPHLFRQPQDELIDPFEDDPEQLPKPPVSPTGP